jgi:hypothetical protein
MRIWAADQGKHQGTESFPRFLRIQQKPERLDDSQVLRQALLDFIADFADWDNSTAPAYLETSRALTQAAHEALGGEPGTRPLVVDPFAGGGSIPLEALRVGADAFASDLNPVPVLLNKVVLEYIPKYGERLADEVRKWGEWIKREAEKELAEFYPKDPDGATPIAYLWARTIKCEGPDCGAEVPLIRSLWLAKKGSRSVALRMVPKSEHMRVDFEMIRDAKDKGLDPPHPQATATGPAEVTRRCIETRVTMRWCSARSVEKRSRHVIEEVAALVDRDVDRGDRPTVHHPGQEMPRHLGEQRPGQDMIHVAGAAPDLLTALEDALDQFFAVGHRCVVVLAHAPGDPTQLESNDLFHHVATDRIVGHDDQPAPQGGRELLAQLGPQRLGECFGGR